jgi:CubicO group peptidase (beta-lactamase class C family)
LVYGLSLQAQPYFKAVQENIADRLAEGNILGVSIAYIYPDGRTRFILRGSLSPKRSKTITKNTIFEIGSISKTFTALMMIKMAEEGAFSLDTPIETLLPNSVNMPAFEDKKITLQHLATHTAGLPSVPFNMSPSDPLNPYADYTVKQMYEFLNEYELTAAPGSNFAYSNLELGLLGHILELQSGKSYEQLLQQYITGPLEMNDTGIAISAQKQARFAAPYNYGEDAKHWDIPTLAGAGAIRSTTEDMATYMKAQMGLQESDLKSAINKTHQISFDTSKSPAIGLGWFYSTQQDTIIWHNGGTGGFKSFAGLNKEEGTAIVVLSNGTESVDDIGLHLLDERHPLKKVRTTVTVDSSTLDSYTGTYQITAAFSITVTKEGDQLMTQATGQQKFPVYPESETKFFLKVVDAQIEFIPDENGNFIKLKLYQGGRVLEGKRVE